MTFYRIRVVITSVFDSKSESEDNDQTKSKKAIKLELPPATDVSLSSVDHTALPRPNLEHDQSRIPLFDPNTLDEDFFETDALETQPISNTPSTPPRSDGNPLLKHEPTIADPIMVPDSPGGFFLQFIKEKVESPRQNEVSKTVETPMENQQKRDADLLDNVFSDSDEECQIPLGQPTCDKSETTPEAKTAAPSVVDLKYELLGRSPGITGNKEADTPDVITQELNLSREKDSAIRLLKRCGANEHDSTIQDDIFAGVLPPLDSTDLSKRVAGVQSQASMDESAFSLPPRSVELFPPTPTRNVPTGPLLAPRESHSKQPLTTVQKASPKREKQRTSKAKAALQSSSFETTGAPVASPRISGVSLGEFRASGSETLLVDATLRGTTPVPENKKPGRRRLSKAQRLLLEATGQTPPLHVVPTRKRTKKTSTSPSEKKVAPRKRPSRRKKNG